MNKVDSNSIMWDRDNCGTAWASDIGFKPGEWPMEFTTKGIVFRRHTRHIDNVDHVIAATYVSSVGDSIKIFND